MIRPQEKRKDSQQMPRTRHFYTYSEIVPSVTVISPANGTIVSSSVELKVLVALGGIAIQGATVRFYVDGLMSRQPRPTRLVMHPPFTVRPWAGAIVSTLLLGGWDAMSAPHQPAPSHALS
jgi:hypothetical protein